MLDALFAFVFQHYVIFGIVAIVVGVALNLVVAVAPGFSPQRRCNKLF